MTSNINNIVRHCTPYIVDEDINLCRAVCKEWRARFSFFGLGSQWWKQYVEAKYHHLGRYVFDKGLHGKPSELGFANNLERAAESLWPELLHGLNLDVYKKAHMSSCEHLSTANTGHFRESFVAFGVSIEDEEHRKPEKIAAVMDEIIVESVNLGLKSDEPIAKLIPSIINEKIVSICSHPEFANRSHPLIRRNNLSVEDVFVRVIDLFHQNMRFAETKEQKLRCIVRYFRLIAWLHPFERGTGRVNLLVTNALLSMHGFHPVSLMDPMQISLSTLDKCVDLFKDGLKRWVQIKKDNSQCCQI